MARTRITLVHIPMRTGGACCRTESERHASRPITDRQDKQILRSRDGRTAGVGEPPAQVDPALPVFTKPNWIIRLRNAPARQGRRGAGLTGAAGRSTIEASRGAA